MIHGHGDDFQGELIANFSSNVCYSADNSGLYIHLSACMGTIERYPEVDAASLQKLIASKSGLNTNQILVTNGSAEAFYLITNAFNATKSVVCTPTFSEYADACLLHKHQLIYCSRGELEKTIQKESPRLVWLCNPNNPDGYIFPIDDLRRLIEHYPETIFIIDQAYADFTQLETFSAKVVNQFSNLILVQSLTKRHAIPGLRLGYLIASEKLISHIKPYCIPWSVNTLAIEAGKYLLEQVNTNFEITDWLHTSKQLQIAINQLKGFRVIPSEMPFFLVQLEHSESCELKAFLLEKGLLIRDAGNFHGLDKHHIRICALSDEKNELLIEQLIAWNQRIIA